MKCDNIYIAPLILLFQATKKFPSSLDIYTHMHTITMMFINVISSVPLSSTIITLMALIGGLLGYLYRPFWRLRKVPGPPSLPLVGHLPLLAKYGPDVFSILAKQYGPIYRFLLYLHTKTYNIILCFLFLT
jgi:hypothetical protein